MARYRMVCAAAILAMTTLVVGDANAALIAQYNANAVTPAPAPDSVEGGSFTANGTRPQNVQARGPGNELGTNYWGVDDFNDTSNGAAGSLFYTKNLDASAFSDPQGWYAQATVRLLSGSNTSSGTALEIRDGLDYFNICLVNDASTDQEYIGYASAASGLVKLVDFELDEAYVTVALTYDPSTAAATVLANGTSIGTLGRADLPNSPLFRFGFGSNTAGATANQHWSLVELGTGVIPEPTTVAALSAAACLALSRHRRHCSNP